MNATQFSLTNTPQIQGALPKAKSRRGYVAFVEAGSFKALEGKTWKHPAVVGDKLYVRNSQ